MPISIPVATRVNGKAFTKTAFGGVYIPGGPAAPPAPSEGILNGGFTGDGSPWVAVDNGWEFQSTRAESLIVNKILYQDMTHSTYNGAVVGLLFDCLVNDLEAKLTVRLRNTSTQATRTLYFEDPCSVGNELTNNVNLTANGVYDRLEFISTSGTVALRITNVSCIF